MISNASDCQSGFGDEYLNKKYTPLIVETNPMAIIQVSSKLQCIMVCLNNNDCSIAVFNVINYQCSIYNTFPIVEQELLPDHNNTVIIFEHKIERKQCFFNRIEICHLKLF